MGHPATNSSRCESRQTGGRLDMVVKAGPWAMPQDDKLTQLAGDDYAEVGDGGEAAEDLVDKTKVRDAHGRVGVEDHDLVEEQIDNRAQGGDFHERLDVDAFLAEPGYLGGEEGGGVGKFLGFGCQFVDAARADHEF